MPFEDNSDPIMMEELLTEVAEGYFGRRRRLDEAIAMLRDRAEALKKREKIVDARAGNLNYLLLEGRAVADFFTAIGVEPGDALKVARPRAERLPVKLPGGRRLKTRFTRRVELAYERLRLACTLHMEGPPQEAEDDGPVAEPPVYYRLVAEISRLVNEEIERANQDMSPANMMIYARKFDVSQRRNARFTGNVSGDYAERIDKKLAYQPVLFDALKLQAYPNLPRSAEVKIKLDTFCRRLWAGHKRELKPLMRF